MNRRRISILTAAVVFSASALAACSANEPHRNPQPDRERAVAISVNSSSTEQLVLGQVYDRILKHEGRETVLSLEENFYEKTRLERFMEGEADFIVGCTGELLAILNPNTAEQLADDLVTAETPAGEAEASNEVYAAFVGSLPVFAKTTDPSPAQGCPNTPDSELPKNVVPVFRAAMLDGSERAAVQGVTKLMTTQDIQDMVEYAEKTKDVAEAVDWWITANNVLPAEADQEREEESENYFYQP